MKFLIITQLSQSPKALPLSSSHSRFFSAAAFVKIASMEVKLRGGPFQKFTESISFDKDLIKHDITGSHAHASMLARQGLITEDDKNIICKRLDDMEEQIERAEFVWLTDREGVHMNIEAALTDLVGEPAKKLHTARSRNDQNLLVEVVKLALKNEGPRLMVTGYTHLQFFEQLARYACCLLDCRQSMNFFLLGACAFAGTGLPIDKTMNLENLGSITPMSNRPDKDNDEGSSGGGNDIDNDEGSSGGGNGIWIRTLAGVGLVIGGVVVGLYLAHKTSKSIESIGKEIVGAVRDWKDKGFPALADIKIEKVNLVNINIEKVNL